MVLVRMWSYRLLCTFDVHALLGRYIATFIDFLSSNQYTNRSYIKKTFTLTIAYHPIPRVTRFTGTCEAAISVTAVSIHITCMLTSGTFIDIYRRNGIYSSILYILNIPPYY